MRNMKNTYQRQQIFMLWNLNLQNQTIAIKYSIGSMQNVFQMKKPAEIYLIKH